MGDTNFCIFAAWFPFFFLVSEYWSYVLVYMCIGRAAYTLGESDRPDGTGM